MSLLKKFAAMAMVAVMAVGMTACGGGDDAADTKTYVIATDTTFAPFEFQNDAGEYVGVDMDLLAAIAEDQGFKYDLQYLGFDAAVQALESGQADGVIAGMSITPERQKKFDFSDPYFDSGVVMGIAESNNDIKSYEDLKGKKVAMTWAYSPSYGKPLSVPQGVIGLMSRFGMEVSLAYPEGYEVMDDVVELAKRQSAESGGSLTISHDMKEAFRDADIVYPKSWAPFKAMEERTELYGNGDLEGIKALERRLLAQNANHKDWECTEEMMKLTKGGKALYLHCLPADITGVSCEAGEVAASVFDRYRDPLYKQASFKPYIIAAMIFLAKVKDPAAKLLELEARGTLRHNG